MTVHRYAMEGDARDVPRASRHIYDDRYYRYINAGAIRSAEHLLPILLRWLTVGSVVDFGAGQGAWLSVWRKLGVTDLTAIDGEYVNRRSLLVKEGQFLSADLTQPVRLGRTYDLVQSLEVAEHLPLWAAETFVDSLVAHGSVILFSAAPPGQGGEHHINEQPYDYWRTLFRARGFDMFDAIRPSLSGNRSVLRWYRYNSFLFVKHTCTGSLQDDLQSCRIHEGSDVADFSPLGYRLRKTFVRRLPESLATRVAVLKKLCATQSLRLIDHD